MQITNEKSTPKKVILLLFIISKIVMKIFILFIQKIAIIYIFK